MSLGFLERAASEVVCRGAFGIGALLVALLMGLDLYRAVRSKATNVKAKESVK